MIETSVGGEAHPWAADQLCAAAVARWQAEPGQAQQEAAAEAALAYVAYPGRVVGELLQNASDAAAYGSTGIEPGPVLVTLYQTPADRNQATSTQTPWVLQVSNTGKPMTAQSLQSLIALRGSHKPDQHTTTIGRFGVGFAAVAAVSDQPQCAGQTAGVRFDAEQARAAAQLPHDCAVPLLRMPFPDNARSLPGYLTTITLPLRDEDAAAAVAAELAALTDITAIQYPGIYQIDVRTDHPEAGGCRTINDVADRWHLWSRRVDTSKVPPTPGTPKMSAARVAIAIPRCPTEDLPYDLTSGPQHDHIPQVLLAPSPTAVKWAWPHLVVIAEVAVDEARTHVLAGAVTELVLTQAATLLAQACTELVSAGTHTIWDLLPADSPASAYDARFRELLATALAHQAILPGADGRLWAPNAATALAETDITAECATWLAAAVPGLVVVPNKYWAWQQIWQIPQGDLHEIFASIPWDHYAKGPGGGRQWLSVLGESLHRQGVRSAIGHVSVPCFGTDTCSARQAVVAVDCAPGVIAGLKAAKVPVVSDAVADCGDGAAVLRAAGATWVDHHMALQLPAVQAWARDVCQQALDEEFWDDEYGLWDDEHDADDGHNIAGGITASNTKDQAPKALPRTGEPRWHTCAHMVLTAVAGGAEPPSWVHHVAWPDEDGQPALAADLVQPHSRLDRWRDPQIVGVVHPQWYSRAPQSVWAKLGVAADLAVVPLAGVDSVEVADLVTGDGVQEWAQSLAVGMIRSGAVVTGVDVVAQDRWGELVRLLDTDPVLRSAFVEPVVAADSVQHSSWAPWWLGQVLGCAGACMGTDSVWLPPPPAEVQGASPELVAALGAIPGLAALDERRWSAVLADAEAVTPTIWDVVSLWEALGTACATGDVPDPPAHLWALDHVDGPVWVSPELVTVVDHPMWAQRVDLGPMIPYRKPPRFAQTACVAGGYEFDEAAGGDRTALHRSVLTGDSLAVDIADWLGATVASDTDAGVITSTGVDDELPRCVHEIVPSAPATWIRHGELCVDDQPVSWWVESLATGDVIHAQSERAAAVAAAWCGGAWDRRHEVADRAAARAGQVRAALGGWAL